MSNSVPIEQRNLIFTISQNWKRMFNICIMLTSLVMNQHCPTGSLTEDGVSFLGLGLIGGFIKARVPMTAGMSCFLRLIKMEL